MSTPTGTPATSHFPVVSTDQPVADLSRAPLPTAKTLRARQNLVVQAGRFALFNARIMRLVLKGDH
ncbi:MAG TPA: hypothetical protein VES95_12880 [Dermatophilaceae bacterium]|nr:hypothetical protein [Dermatophilaceae bacterium]